MAIQVVNQKHVRGTGVEVEYVGRWHPEFKRESPLKNDWSHVPNSKARHVVATRREAVECYRRWLWGEIKRASGPAFVFSHGLSQLACLFARLT